VLGGVGLPSRGVTPRLGERIFWRRLSTSGLCFRWCRWRRAHDRTMRRSVMNATLETIAPAAPNTPENAARAERQPGSFGRALKALCRPVLALLDCLSCMPAGECDPRFGHFHPSRGLK